MPMDFRTALTAALTHPESGKLLEFQADLSCRTRYLPHPKRLYRMEAPKPPAQPKQDIPAKPLYKPEPWIAQHMPEAPVALKNSVKLIREFAPIALPTKVVRTKDGNERLSSTCEPLEDYYSRLAHVYEQHDTAVASVLAARLTDAWRRYAYGK